MRWEGNVTGSTVDGVNMELPVHQQPLYCADAAQLLLATYHEAVKPKSFYVSTVN